MIYVADPLLCGDVPIPVGSETSPRPVLKDSYPHTRTHIILPKNLSAVMLLRPRLVSPPPSHVIDKTATHKAVAVNHYGLMAACRLTAGCMYYEEMSHFRKQHAEQSM